MASLAPPPVSPRDGNLRRRRRLWIEWFGTAAFAIALLAGLVYSGVTSRLDNAVYDFSLHLMKRSPHSDIVIVTVDPTSITRAGEWPWPRATQALLVQRIAEQHPRALAWLFLAVSPSDPKSDAAFSRAFASTTSIMPVWISHGIARPPIPSIRSALKSLALSEAEGDADGIVRHTRLTGEGVPLPHIATELAKFAPEAEAQKAAKVSREFGTRAVLIPYVGSAGAFPRIRAIDLIEGRAPKDALEGKLVLVGATASGLLDNYPTPVTKGDGMPEAEVDANVLDALLTGRVIVDTSPLFVLVASSALVLALLLMMVRLGPNESLWAGLFMGVVPLALVIVAVTNVGIWIRPAPYLVTICMVLPFWGWRRLNAASAYFAAELKALEAESDVVAAARADPASALGGDVVLQQMALLEEAKRRISDLRRFVADMLSNFPDPVFVVDRAGGVLAHNQAGAEFAAKIGQAAVAGADIQPILAGLSIKGQLWPPTTDRLTQPPTSEGVAGRHYEVRFTPTHDVEENQTGWIVHLADVTALVGAMRSREEALQLLSHDMRSPQAAILATLNHPEFRQAPQGLRGIIESQARRTLEMADAFVRLAKAEVARYRFEPIDLGMILQDATEAVWSLGQSRGVGVRRDVGDDEFLVLADRSMMTRALVNLLDNAVKFSPSGAEVVCTLRLGQRDGRPVAICEITDSAGGMDQDELDDLFTKFASGRDAVSGSPGIGLGLALVRTVVTRHDGAISCRSTRGKGTTFTLTFPILAEAEAERIERELAAA